MRLFWLVTLGGCGLSVLATLLVERFLATRIAIVGSAIGLVRSFNRGVAFGITLHPDIQIFLIAIALFAVFWMAFRAKQNPLAQVGFGLIIGGGIANIFDRVQDGFVTDFVQVGSFPIFNIADSCITVGVVLLLLEALTSEKARKKKR
ncbi:MAG: signal peptidase II [Candidatus Peribacteraceae bacterium]|nr:signal peptidase II [Candidatus Peribacteraceae bacterium]